MGLMIGAEVSTPTQGQEYGLKKKQGTSLVVQWPRVHASNAGSQGFITGQGTRPHMLQPKITDAATKTWNSQISK